MDLTQSFPRSPKLKMSGLIMVPRMIDKARAYNSKTLGEYVFPCPLDKIIMDFLNTDHEEVANISKKLTDREIVLWINKKCLIHSEKEKEEVNQKILKQKPNTQESLNRFNKLLNVIDSTQKDITTWVDLLELEEKRTSPERPQ